MNRAELSKRITAILTEITRMTNTLYAMNMSDVQRYPENYALLARDAACRSEAIACRMRHLLYESSDVKKRDYLLSAADTQGVKVGYHDEMLEVTLPALMPKRKRSQYPEFLLDPFTAALSQYSEEHTLPQFEHCVICFCQIFDRTQSERRIRDYDNVEYKQLLDVAAAFVMIDDSGQLCELHYRTELGSEDCTKLFIMSEEHFPRWYMERQRKLENSEIFTPAARTKK